MQIRTCLLAVMVAVVPAVLRAQEVSMPPEMRGDAELTSVTFVDADTGWAVGDRGVIWHTIDGGRHWQQQNSNTSCRLESVAFVDHEHGWAAGGYYRPYTHQSVGVVLRTDDGGKTWENIKELNIPVVRSMQFSDPLQGNAYGERSSLYPTGLFTTHDGGRSWTTKVGDPKTKPSEGKFLFPQHAVRDTLRGKVEIGLEGAIDDFSSIASARLNMPPVAKELDLAANASVGEHRWAAGNPGTLVFHSGDDGKTWQSFRTDSNAPLKDIFFLDVNRGWAVGSLGTILATRDGGQTWRVQRQGARRTALLAVVSRAERLPYELLVLLGANEGYVAGAEVIASEPRSDAKEIGQELCISQAAREAGVAWCESQRDYPVSKFKGCTIDGVLAEWNSLHDGKALEDLDRHLVKVIRTQRPDVIITEDASPRGADPLAHIVNQLVLAAVQKASDANAYPEQITQLHLSAWKVKKVFSMQIEGKQGTVNLLGSQLAPRLATSLADVADNARSLLTNRYELGPASQGFSLLVDELPQGQGRRDIFSGIALAPGSEARRVLPSPPATNLPSLTRHIQARQKLQEMLERSQQDPIRGSSWIVQVDEMTRGLSPMSAGRSWYFLAERYQESGEIELAAQSLEQLLKTSANHPLSDCATLELIRLYASAERSWQARRASQVGPNQVAESLAGGEVKLASFTAPVNESLFAALHEKKASDRAARALSLGKMLEQTRPQIYTDPALRMTLASLARREDQKEVAIKLWNNVAVSSESWNRIAKAELWLGKKEERTPRYLAQCSKAATKPKLDGRLDDEVWQSANSLTLTQGDAANQSPAMVAIAYDAEFLYVAASARKRDDIKYLADSQVRSRDADLQNADRIELDLDTDRDYSTSYELAVDHRGRTRDRLAGDAAWNPTWYVAAGGDDLYWTCEAAISLSDLIDGLPNSAEPWAINVRRVFPSGQSQDWSPPLPDSPKSRATDLLLFAP